MILFVQNDPTVPPAVFAELLAAEGHPFTLWHAYTADPPPSLPVYDGVILLGGTMGVGDLSRDPYLARVADLLSEILARQIPFLGICLGGQLLAAHCGRTGTSRACGERGLHAINLTRAAGDDPLFRGMVDGFRAFQWHDDSFSLPDGAVQLAATAVCPCQAFRFGRAWGVQFHPEVDQRVVAVWSNGDPQAQALVAEFAVAAATQLAVARVLLGNFLRLSGVASQLA